MTSPERAAVVLLVSAACVFDLRERRIPNALTLGSAVAGLLFAFLVHGPIGLGMAVLGWVVGCALFAPFFVLGGTGAGDVKLLAALGAWVGPGLVCWVAIYAALAGGVLALAVSARQGYLKQSFVNLLGLLAFWRAAGIRPMPGMTLHTADSPRLPYAVPIAAGALAALWLR